MIDSVQTLYSSDVGSAPGSVSQVREAAARLLRVGKEAGVALFLVGHVTKDGAVAGPRVLEHLVDCVLQFEGDRYHAHRILRATKNRFGSTNELGVFEMTGTGLVGVPDPSQIFGAAREEEVGSAVACALEGTRPLLLEIQALVSPTDLAMPRRVGTGVDPKRLAMIVAVLTRHGGSRSAPPTSSSTSPAASGSTSPAPTSPWRWRSPRPPRTPRCPPARRRSASSALTGRLRPATQAERRLEECAKLGLADVIVPAATKAKRGVNAKAVETVRQAIGSALAAKSPQGEPRR